jgi:tRNA(Arg) A34 adenosine deaminase TadA
MKDTIFGVLVGQDNVILAWGLNMKNVNPTFHAEAMMIQYWLTRNPNATSLPAGCRIYTSLECYNMCAGHIVTLGCDIQVYYGHHGEAKKRTSTFA